MMMQSLAAAPDDFDDDLYSGYNEFHPALDTKNLQNDEDFHQAALKSSYGRKGLSTAHRQPGPSRMGTAGFRKASMTPSTGRRASIQPPTTARPMTSVRGAGYSSVGRSPNATAFDPLNQAKTMASSFVAKDESSPEAKIRILEKKVNILLEESIKNSFANELSLGLEKAKEAVAKEKVLSRQKEQFSGGGGEGISINLDLTFAVLFNLALQYTKSEMYSEAINLYSTMLKNRSFSNTGRLKVNIGKIYYLQGNYTKAVKFFRMALDQIPNTQKDMRMKIMKNIGLSFVRLHQYPDAITSFEYIMGEKADVRTALHLIVCHYALGDKQGMRKNFSKLLEIQSESKLSDEKGSGVDEEDATHAMINEVIKTDDLQKIEKKLKQEQDWSILTSAKLISPVVGDTFTQGYEWTVEQIRSAGYTELSNDLEINKAVKHLKKREFNQAIETLKSFEKKDSKSASTAATNLSFLYLLQNELVLAEKCADDAISANHYNSGAIVNKGNVCFKRKDFERSFEYYREALMNESTCLEALYNMMLANKKLGKFTAALESAYKLNSILKNHPYILYQTANIYEIINDKDQCLDWYQKVLAFVPSDPSLLTKLSDLADAERDKQQAFTHLMESYRYFPSHIPTIERLAGLYIENQVFEKSIRYLEKAAAVQPNEIKWPLMTAACYRRSGNYQAALQCYIKIHIKFPENVESLKFMSRISHDLDLPEAPEYLEKLKKLEKMKELNNQRKDVRSASRASRRSAASSSREGSASSNSSGYMTEASRNGFRSNGRHKSIFEMDNNRNKGFDDDLDSGINERPTTSWRRRQLIDQDDFAGDEVNDILPD